MLMGATLPAIARARGAESVGYLYMAKPRGRRHGRRSLAGFYLLRVYDTVIATAVAVAINIVIAMAFFAMARRADIDDVPAEEPRLTAGEGSIAPIYVTAGAVCFTALGAEWLWTRQLSLLFGASVYTFSLILAVFLAGLGIGGLAGTALSPRVRAANALGLIQALLAGANRLRCVRDRERIAALAADGAVPPARAQDAVADVHV
jgi:spermidine synthase